MTQRWTIDGEYLYTSDVRVVAEIAEAQKWHFELEWSDDGDTWFRDIFDPSMFEWCDSVGITFRIHRDVVREVCELEEGELCVVWTEDHLPDYGPSIEIYEVDAMSEYVWMMAANAVTLTDVGQLRTLHLWVWPEGRE